ncbi:MAG: GNAT family N-acetyltransferase [Hamadaea sp.]|nr:GNAT family N-acetyltransferase [Hamadaea sp.]
MFATPLGDGADLRPLEPWQADEFLAHMERGTREHIRPWVGKTFPPENLERARHILQRYADRRCRDDGGIWGIWLDGVLVGGVLLVSFDAEGGVCEAGCWLEPTATGKGLVTRAATVLLDWVFRVRGMHRVEWHTRADNVASGAVAQRLGMTLDGTMRESWLTIDDRRVDTNIWSVLAPEWLAR